MSMMVKALAAASGEWARTPADRRFELLEEVRRKFGGVMQQWVDLSVAAKGGAPAETIAAEDWLSGPLCILRNLRLLSRSLKDLAEGRKPALPSAPRTTPGGRTVVQVLPSDLPDRLAFPGFAADIWFQKGITPTDVPSLQAEAYSGGPADRGVCLVLGAGNVSSIPAGDVLYKLFVENRTVLLKTSPVLAYLTPLLREAFAPLVDAGVLGIVDGGREEGEALVVQPDLAEIHVTGALETHLRILETLRGRGLRTRLSSELGNVSPVIVVPGPWSDSDLDFHAQSLATMLVNNAGFNCNAARILVLPEGWPGTDRLLDMLRFQLAAIPTRNAYYPGAAQRCDRFLEAHPEALCFGDRSGDHLPWVLIPDLDPENRGEICFSTEPFCGVFGAVRLPGSGPSEFLGRAVRFANESLWGTLNATVIVHPETRSDLESEGSFEAAVAGLRYGTVALNHWPGVDFGMMSTPWGGYPGGTLEDPGSGLGFVHNTLMLGGIEKAVVDGPFAGDSIPPWFVTAEGSHKLFARLAKMLTTMAP